MDLVYGFGFNDRKYPAAIMGRATKTYEIWKDMLFRCTDKGWNKQPSYRGATCSENFKSYSYFYEWCNRQTGFGNIDEQGKGWHLDKDILVRGNKLYSEDTCVFVPRRINILFTKADTTRGEYPIGVSFIKRVSRFRAVCNNGKGKLKHLGYFNTVDEAFLAYKTFKEAIIKSIACEYRDSLDNRVYHALHRYTVRSTD